MERPISHDKLLVTGACVRDELYDHVIPKMIVLMLFDNMTTKSSSHKLEYYKIDCNYFEYLYSEMEFVIQHYDYVEITKANGETSTQACHWTDSLLKFIQQHRCCVNLTIVLKLILPLDYSVLDVVEHFVQDNRIRIGTLYNFPL